VAITGLDHVNIRTTELAKTQAFFTEVLDARRKLDAAGLAYEPSQAPNGGIRQLFVTELNGVTIELNHRAPTPT